MEIGSGSPNQAKADTAPTPGKVTATKGLEGFLTQLENARVKATVKAAIESLTKEGQPVTSENIQRVIKIEQEKAQKKEKEKVEEEARAIKEDEELITNIKEKYENDETLQSLIQLRKVNNPRTATVELFYTNLYNQARINLLKNNEGIHPKSISNEVDRLIQRFKQAAREFLPRDAATRKFLDPQVAAARELSDPVAAAREFLYPDAIRFPRDAILCSSHEEAKTIRGTDEGNMGYHFFIYPSKKEGLYCAWFNGHPLNDLSKNSARELSRKSFK